MSKIQTVGDLRAALAEFGDDVRVVVDGYEGGFADVTLTGEKVRIGVPYSWGGPHSDYPDWMGEEEVPHTMCLCLSRHEISNDDSAEVLETLKGGAS